MRAHRAPAAAQRNPGAVDVVVGHSSDPVVVVGRLRIHDWDNGVKTGINVDLDADTIGHNLRWGTTVFTRTIRSTSTSDLDPGEVAGDDESGPDWTSNDGGQPSDEAESVAEPATERSEVVVPF